MKFGLIELLGALRFFKGANYVGFKPPASIPSSFEFTLPDALPGSTQSLTVDSLGNWGYQAIGGGGSVTSVALTVPSFLSVAGSPITTNGTLALTLASQTANTIFAAPNGSAGAPSFRSLVYADFSALVGTGSNTIAAGNDSRFHTQGTDTGTTQTSFQIDSGSSGVRLKNSSGALRLRNAADSADADLIIANLTVTGTTTTVNAETVTIADNILLLNSDVTGTPTQDAGIQVERGSATDASLLWDETNDLWKAGVAGSEIAIARVYRTSFNNASLTTGVLSVTHNLGQQYSQVEVYDNNNKKTLPDEVTTGSSTACTIDLTSFGTLTGTWQAVVIG